MRTENLAIEFASGATKGKNYTGSMYISGKAIYSYGSHWPIAFRLSKNKYAMNISDNSVTTNKQRNLVKRIMNKHKHKIKEMTIQEIKKLI